MSNTEKSYGFMVTSSAHESADVPIKTKLQVFAGATGTTPLVGILQTRFIVHALQYIRTQNNFSVISYHGRMPTVRDRSFAPTKTKTRGIRTSSQSPQRIQRQDQKPQDQQELISQQLPHGRLERYVS
jgi:hypothetical protein